MIHDLVVEYFLTEDRKLKLRFYGKWDKDEVVFQNQQKYGIGINYRQEFGNLSHMRETFNNDIGKLLKDALNQSEEK